MYEEETKNLADEHFRVRRNFTVDYILGRFDKAASICDLGCGAGPVTVDLITHGYRVVGVDYSFDMLENARRRAEHEYHQLQKSVQSLNAGKVGTTLKALSKKQLRHIKKTRLNAKTGVVEYVPAYAK